MPSHQDRREPLPKGYQYGDAVLGPELMREGWHVGGHIGDKIVIARVDDSVDWRLVKSNIVGWNDLDRGEH